MSYERAMGGITGGILDPVTVRARSKERYARYDNAALKRMKSRYAVQGIAGAKWRECQRAQWEVFRGGMPATSSMFPWLNLSTAIPLSPEQVRAACGEAPAYPGGREQESLDAGAARELLFRAADTNNALPPDVVTPGVPPIVVPPNDIPNQQAPAPQDKFSLSALVRANPNVAAGLAGGAGGAVLYPKSRVIGGLVGAAVGLAALRMVGSFYGGDAAQ